MTARLLVCDAGSVTHSDLADDPRYVLDLRDPTDSDDCAAQRWCHPEHHTAACIKHLRMIPVRDGETVPADAIVEAVAWYRAVRNEDPHALVVIHCFAGVSRSATVAYAILRACHGLDRFEALRRVQTRIPRFDGVSVHPREWIRCEAERLCDGGAT